MSSQQATDLSEWEHPWRQEEVLRRLYHDKGMTGYDIAERFGCDNWTVYSWMHKLGVKEREHDEPATAPTKLRDPEWLKEQYWSKRRTQADIAEELGCGSTTVSTWMEKHDIETRNKNGNVRKLPNSDREYHKLFTDKQGYERWGQGYPVHRLACVAWYGIEAVKDKEVHHENNIPWDNRECNIEPLTKSEHSQKHAGGQGSIWSGYTVNLTTDEGDELLQFLAGLDIENKHLEGVQEKLESALERADRDDPREDD